MKKRNMWLPAILLLVMLVFIVTLVVDLVPILAQVLKDRNDESKMVSYIDAYGAKGTFLIVGLQALQVIVAVIPSAAIQVLAGLCYGIWGGAALCLFGYVLGNILVFVALRQFGKVLGPLFSKRAKKEEAAVKKKGWFNLQSIGNMQNPQRAAFWLHLIPGIPNGILPYLFARSKITFLQYLVAMIAGCGPSVLICTWLGERLSKGDWKMALIIAGSVVVLMVVVLLFKNRLMGRVAGGKTPDGSGTPKEKG